MLTYENVVNAPVAKLHTAVADWQAVAAKLEELAEAARHGMKATSDKAEWSGVTAGVARRFVDKTAKEFEDAAREAKGIHRALAEGHTAFTAAREKLRGLAEHDIPAAGFRIDGRGVVTAAPLLTDGEKNAARHDPDYQELIRVNLPKWQARIDAAVDACDDADRSLARLLGANVTGALDFSPPRYAGLDAEQAGRATDLARRGRALTHDELAELNELLADNAHIPEFARNFYAALGPRGALEFFGRMSTDTYDYAELDEQRLADVRALQRNLGLNLATATRSTSEPHLPDGFAQELRRLGTQPVPLGRYEQSPPYGYQLLGGIMRYGTYDPKFLLPIAEHATQLHAKEPDFFTRTRQLTGPGRSPLNPSGLGGAGYDPVVGFLEALGHSPAAAKQFFDPDRPPHAYTPEGTPLPGRADLGRGANKQPIQSYLDFFAREKYEATLDTTGTNPDDYAKSRAHMPNAIGHALEAATLGHAWDAPSPVLHRTEEGARVMEAVAAKYGGDAALLEKHEALADSLGNMTAGYIDDVSAGIDGKGDESVFAQRSAQDGQAHVAFDREGARDLLSALGQHPDAYATVSTAERIHASSVLETQGIHDGQVDEGRARATIRTSAEVQGMLDESRAEQVRAVGKEKHEEYEKAHEQRAAWVEFGGTAALAAGVAFLPATAAAAGAAAIAVPIAVDVGSGVVEQAASQVVGQWSDGAVKKHEDGIDGRTHDSTKAMYQAGERSAEAPMHEFMRRHTIDPNSEFGNDFLESMRNGYQTGNSRARQQGHDPETGK
ncbi:hypothetical protein [Streptomyces sp. NPDC091268]|uniref:hypothetical protein n=1 Tax=Streptomyces sp. NPDC091268 TaxID=3365979 RepID=UPI0037F87D65